MSVINIETIQTAKAAQRKEEIIKKVAASIAKIHYSNLDYVYGQIVDHAEMLAYVYSKPNEARKRENKKPLQCANTARASLKTNHGNRA